MSNHLVFRVSRKFKVLLCNARMRVLKCYPYFFLNEQKILLKIVRDIFNALAILYEGSPHVENNLQIHVFYL